MCVSLNFQTSRWWWGTLPVPSSEAERPIFHPAFGVCSLRHVGLFCWKSNHLLLLLITRISQFVPKLSDGSSFQLEPVYLACFHYWILHCFLGQDCAGSLLNCPAPAIEPCERSGYLLCSLQLVCHLNIISVHCVQSLHTHTWGAGRDHYSCAYMEREIHKFTLVTPVLMLYKVYFLFSHFNM